MVEFFYCSVVISKLFIAVNLAAKKKEKKEGKKTPSNNPRNHCAGWGSVGCSVSELTASGGRDVRFTAIPAFLPPQL